MINNRISTLGSQLLRQQQVADLQKRLEKAGTELATGQVQDIAQALGSDLETYESLVRQQEFLTAGVQRLQIAGGRLEAVQASLAALAGGSGNLGENLSAALGRRDETSLSVHLEEAANLFEQSLSHLNGEFGGRYLFAGSALDAQPLADSAAFTAEIASAAGGATGIAAKLAAIDALFASGLPANVYSGDDVAPTVEAEAGALLPAGMTASDPDLREHLQGLAMLAALEDDSLVLSGPDRARYIAHATNLLEQGHGDLTQAQARLGLTQESLEHFQTHQDGKKAAIDLQIQEMVGVDPMEAASHFQALETQLQASFLLVSRLSQLSLTNFLR